MTLEGDREMEMEVWVCGIIRSEDFGQKRSATLHFEENENLNLIISILRHIITVFSFVPLS